MTQVETGIEAGMQKRWQVAQQLSDDQLAQAAELAGQLRIAPLIGQLLVGRGWTDPKQAEPFLKPKLVDLHDPILIPGMRRAAQRLAKAVADGQPIVIYGDYDVDGVTATAILWHTLKLAGAQVSTYVPHRMDEGYGLNVNAIAQFCADDPKPVIVSVDCGVTAVEPARLAAEAGVDLIITDHHVFDEADLPDAYAIVHPCVLDPKRGPDDPSEVYPFEGLCGAGVALKLAWQTARVHCGCERLPKAFRDLMMDLLSLAALGTVADVVPLVDENRVIAHYGLGQIKRTSFDGLNALIDTSNLRGKKVDAYHVGFVLGPRLNACGRMGHAKDAVELLTTADKNRATDISEFLNGENNRRRATEKAITNDAKQMVIDSGYDQPDSRVIVVGSNDWHRGVVGIVASRLVDTFSRPAIVLDFGPSQSNEIGGNETGGNEGAGNGASNGNDADISVDDETASLAQGSARSIEGFSIHDALSQCAGLLTSFGGHAMAAGLKLPVESVDEFRRQLVEYTNTVLSVEDLAPVIHVDGQCDLGQIDIAFCKQLDLLAPFGQGNRTPILCVRDVLIDQPPQVMGKGGAHLRLVLRDGSVTRKAVAFGMGKLAERLPRGARIDVAFEPKLSEWRGVFSAEAHIKDVKLV
jgi:single-stranded-DNA-specific exonuclease